MSDTNGTDNDNQPRGFEAVKNHMLENKIETALWVSRCLSIIFAIGYLLPIFGSSQSAFYKVLISNAATSALRLHQRLPRIQFTKEFLALLLIEDSCHYLFFSLIFLYVQPFILILFPVVLFAVLHSASYSLKILDMLGQNSWWGARLMISLVEFQQRNILRLIAFSEIFLMPIAVVSVFMGRAGLMTPFIYYHFLTLRYTSRRNPHTRNMFHELKLATEVIANNPKAPPIVGKVLHGAIRLVTRLAPPTPVQQAQ
ncbi:CLUMA_CG013993, isoform A [Clunio marinus]|uniref:CLUMA_CG013993, isoform A n=1 Tax=Clunio marinus TaxID=568069 RepID=A0A1J1IQF6_9DIPT|nr:CLUMA_CG013993, isoform A [Clunio marinus]